MFGKWAWGFWQCKNHYETQQELLDVVARYRSLHVPIDGIIQDWQYWNPHPWGSHQFDENRYPDPVKLMRDLHSPEHCTCSFPFGPKFDVDSPNAERTPQCRGLYSQVLRTFIRPGKGRWYDPFNPAARRDLLEAKFRENFCRYGIDGWWLDASEPEIEVATGRVFVNSITAAGFRCACLSTPILAAHERDLRRATRRKLRQARVHSSLDLRRRPAT